MLHTWLSTDVSKLVIHPSYNCSYYNNNDGLYLSIEIYLYSDQTTTQFTRYHVSRCVSNWIDGSFPFYTIFINVEEKQPTNKLQDIYIYMWSYWTCPLTDITVYMSAISHVESWMRKGFKWYWMKEYSKNLYPYCLVLVGSRNRFERDFTIELK